jgi:hypothetical protein
MGLGCNTQLTTNCCNQLDLVKSSKENVNTDALLAGEDLVQVWTAVVIATESFVQFLAQSKCCIIGSHRLTSPLEYLPTQEDWLVQQFP